MSSNNDLIQVACVLTREQHARLKQLSQQSHVPMSVYFRQAVKDLLAKYRKEVKA